MKFVAWFVLGASVGCAVADVEARRWGEAVIGLVAAGVCAAALMVIEAGG